MSASTDMTAEQLLDLAWRTARTCRERQRRVAARAEEDRARLAALHAHVDELERENARLRAEANRPSDEPQPRPNESARSFARRRGTLTGANAQALEGALSLTERERDEARARVAVLEAQRDDAIARAEVAEDERDEARQLRDEAAVGAALFEKLNMSDASERHYERLWREECEAGSAVRAKLAATEKERDAERATVLLIAQAVGIVYSTDGRAEEAGPSDTIVAEVRRLVSECARVDALEEALAEVRTKGGER